MHPAQATQGTRQTQSLHSWNLHTREDKLNKVLQIPDYKIIGVQSAVRLKDGNEGSLREVREACLEEVTFRWRSEG